MTDVDGAWFVYVLVSASSRRTYVGVTNDVERRVEQHNGERPGGAKSTRAARPWRVARRLGPFESRGRALEEEHRVKSLGREARLAEGEPA